MDAIIKAASQSSRIPCFRKDAAIGIVPYMQSGEAIPRMQAGMMPNKPHFLSLMPAKMPWIYHLGHLLRAMEDTARDIFGQPGVDAVGEAMKEYADTFSAEAAGQIRESSRQDFDSLPPGDAE